MADPLPNPALEQRLDPVIAEYLESIECGGSSDPTPWLARYPELADELEDFFAAEARFGRLVAPLRTNSPASAAGTSSADSPPLRTVQDYELLSELGHGGMGIIHKARQRSLNRFVAIKMIRSAEWATPQERLRFRWEAETVATLDHPNIVPIYEVGEITSEVGARLPFFSMKLIEGENLSQARERFRNDWNSIARLMSLVTRAVEHAHQRGVLHRDLKPANILLAIRTDDVSTEELRRGSGFLLGASFITPHISDFGLARRTQHHRGGTLPGTIVGTPSYLAPELVRGHEFATSASDVYSLGAILYELLTGVPPFQAGTPLETIRLAADNAVTLPRKLNPAIPPDLETICLKCLETEADKRYSSADKLAEDLEHFLACRPIAARPVGSLERFWRWCRRQPVIAGLSAAAVLVVLGSLPLIIWNWQRALQQEHLAETRLSEAQQERDRADEASGLAQTRLSEAQQERDRADEAFGLAHSAVEDVFRLLAEDRWEEMPGSEAFKKQLLEHGLRHYRTFVERRRDDPKLQRQVAEAMFRIGLIASKLGPKREAVESFQRAISLLRSLTKEFPDDAGLRKSLARSLVNLGNALGALNLRDEAIAAHEEAAEVWAQLPKELAPAGESAREQARAWINRGVALQPTEDWQRVLESFRRAQTILTENGLAAKETRLMILCLLNISQAEDHLGRQEEAFRDAREANRLAERMLKASPQSEEVRSAMAYAARSLGNLQRKADDLDAAKTNLQLAQKTLDDLHQQRPRVTEYAWNLAGVNEELAALAEKQKQPRDAVKALLQAESLLLELVERDGESHPNRVLLAGVERRLGRLQQELGNWEGMRKAHQQAKIQLEYLLDHNSPRSTLRLELAGVCQQLGVANARLNKHPEALVAAEEAAKHYRVLLERTPTDAHARKNLSSVLGNAAIAHRTLKHYPEAVRVTEDRVRLWPNNSAELYDAATDFARTFDSASRAKEPATQARDQALKASIDALRQAIRAGFTDREKIRTATVFAPLRETAEFRAFLAELEEAPP